MSARNATDSAEVCRAARPGDSGNTYSELGPLGRSALLARKFADPVDFPSLAAVRRPGLFHSGGFRRDVQPHIAYIDRSDISPIGGLRDCRSAESDPCFSF